jgi:hypothetical protein
MLEGTLLVRCQEAVPLEPNDDVADLDPELGSRWGMDNAKVDLC